MKPFIICGFLVASIPMCQSCDDMPHDLEEKKPRPKLQRSTTGEISPRSQSQIINTNIISPRTQLKRSKTIILPVANSKPVAYSKKDQVDFGLQSDQETIALNSMTLKRHVLNSRSPTFQGKKIDSN